MNTPIWLYCVQSWRLAVYAVAMLVLVTLWTKGILSAVPEERDSGRFRKTVSLLCPTALVAQGMGFLCMGVFLSESSDTLVSALRAAEYNTFATFRIPLVAYAIGFAVIYAVCRYGCFRDWKGDAVSRKVAATLIALFAAPWIVLLPIAR